MCGLATETMGKERQRVTRRAALALMGGGALYGVSDTLGLASITATRGATVGVTDDPDAYLGFDGYSDTNKTPTFTNHTDNSMDVTLTSQDDTEFDVGTDGNWAAPPVTFSLAVDGSKQVDIRWVGDCVDSGSAAVSTDATLTDADGNTIGAISFDREWKIPEAGQVQFNGSASSAGSSGKYEFTLENTGCEDVTFVGIGINETSTDADYVSGSGSLFNLDTGEELITDSIPIDSSDPDSDTRRDMNPTVSLPQDEMVTFQFDKFRRNGSGKKNVDMQGEDVRITLYLSDGSSATEKLCLGSCDF